MSNQANDKLIDNAKDTAIECPMCKELSWVVIHYASDYDEFECDECGHYGTMGK